MDVKVTRQVRALSGDLLKPRYRMTYIIMSEGRKQSRLGTHAVMRLVRGK
ncbi:hypothetical protein [Vulcanisaeta sp. JCM 14467]